MFKITATKRPFLTIPECAKEFGFPVATIRSLVKQEAFPVMKVGSAAYIMRETFSTYLQSLAFQGSTEIVESRNG
mgnify:CR=1 FL=1